MGATFNFKRLPLLAILLCYLAFGCCCLLLASATIPIEWLLGRQSAAALSSFGATPIATRASQLQRTTRQDDDASRFRSSGGKSQEDARVGANKRWRRQLADHLSAARPPAAHIILARSSSFSSLSSVVAAAARRKTAPDQRPPSKLMFSNQTGAVAQCGVALDLAQNIAKADRQLAGKLHHQSQNTRHLQLQQHAANAQLIMLLQKYDIKIRWEKADGGQSEQTELEQFVYGSGLGANQRGALLRFVRPSDQALVFEPFRPQDFRPDLHAATYRCVASSSSMGASLVSRDMRARAIVASSSIVAQGTWSSSAPPLLLLHSQVGQNSIEVLDELVLEGNSALFRCQVPNSAQDYLQVLDWIEYPSEQTLTYQSTTLASANLLFRPPNNSSNSIQQQQTTTAVNQVKYFVAPKSGDLHILNVFSNFNYRSYKCRCKNKLTGEVISSTNKGKLIVSESHSPLAPRSILDTPSQIVHEEGELALLNCNTQSFSRWSKFSWSFKQPNGGGPPIALPVQSDKYAQLANLLLINQVNRNDSGVYICHVKNNVGEEQLELELAVKAPLRASLTSSARVLELGKSLSLECTIRGYPIHQVVFRHNQNVIKSISGLAAAGSHNHHSIGGHNHKRHPVAATGPSQQTGGYFVVDGSSTQRADLDQSADQSATAATADKEANNHDDDDDNNNNNDGDNDHDHDHDQQDGQPMTAQEMEHANEVKLSHVVVIVLEPQHAGAYQCFAFNQYESVQASTYIRVLDDPPKFKDTFRAEVYELGQDISLQCSARANPLPEITWSIDDQPIPESARTRFGDFVTKDNLVISYVNISNTQVIDSGLYRCTADNGLAQVSHQAQISVSGPLQIKPMANQTVVASESLRIRCPVAGYPVHEIQWLKEGRRLPANHRQRVYENGTLEVEHMEKNQGDEGEYTCLASSKGGGALASAQSSLQVNIRARPTIEPFSVSRSLREGQRASITCTLSSGDLPISISWFRNEQPLLPTLQDSVASSLQVDVATSNNIQQPPQVSSSSLSSSLSPAQQESGPGSSTLVGVRISRVSDYSSSLLFESLLAEHSGNYTCLARNDAGSVSHQTPMVVQVAPKWSIEPTDTSIVRGFSMSIDCVANGFPPARIIWTKAGGGGNSDASNLQTVGQQQQLIQSREPPKLHHHLGSWVYENGSLNILDARDSDVGHYMCQASNGVGPGLSKVIKVTINVAAQFNVRHSIQYAAKGESVNLKCQAKGDWPLLVHWFKNKYRLEPINLQDDPSAANQATDEQQHRPFIISATKAALLLPSSSPITSSSLAQLQQPQPQQQQHHQQKPRGSVLEQLNALLSSSSSSGQLDGGLISSSGVSQQQQQPQQSGLVLQRYSLATSELSGALEDVESLQATAARGPRFDHLAPKQQAQLQQQQPLVIQVRSVLSISQLERQDTGTFKCLAANHFGFDERTIQLIVQEAPDNIEDLSILEVNSRSITLGWLAPYDGNSPIIKYHIQYRPLGAPLSPSSGDLLQPLSLSATDAKQQSSLMVSQDALDTLAWLNYTLSAASSSSSSSTTTTTIESSGASNASSLNGFSSLLGAPHSRQQQPSAGAPDEPLPSGGGGGKTLVKVIVNNLKPMTRYWFRVQAENKLGHGRVSQHVESRTIEEAPASVPTKLKAVAQSSTSILVSWHKLNEKDFSTGPIHGYYVAYRQLVANETALLGQYGAELSVASGGGQQSSSGADETQAPVTNIYKTVQHTDRLSKFDALLTNLKRTTKYVVSVQAFNGRGIGPASEPIVVQTLEMDRPKQVKLYVKSSNNCSIQLEWRPMSQAAMALIKAASMRPATKTSTGPATLPTAVPLMLAADEISNAELRSAATAAASATTSQSEADLVDYYSLYRAELNERPQWQETRLPGHLASYQAENLRCGTRYQFYMIGVNRIGAGDQSDILDTKTDGGLPLAPDRQSTFDVINSTCYIIRLDHWQDNGCPIREFNIRFKYESARQWTHLAHFDLMAGGAATGEQQQQQVTKRKDNDLQQLSGSLSGDSLSSSVSTTNSRAQRRLIDETNDGDDDDDEELDLRQQQQQAPLSRTSRASSKTQPASNGNGNSNSNNDTNVYPSSSSSSASAILSGGGSASSVNADDTADAYGDTFLDYSLAVDSAVAATGGNSDYSALFSSSSSSSVTTTTTTTIAPMAAFNLSNLVQQQADSQLFSLLKDSMIPAFEPVAVANELEQRSPSSSSVSAFASASASASASTSAARDHSNGHDKWQVMNFISSSEGAASSDKNSSSIVAAHNRQQQPSGLDWKRVRFCNLADNVYYSIQITAANSVGETEAELRLLTSQEGLEYDEQIKRQVVGRLGSDRLALSGGGIQERFRLFSFANQWPILLPITLTLVLITILFIISIILRRSNDSGSSTSTTTTMSSSNHHCQSYLNDSRQSRACFKGVPSSAQSAITETATVDGSDIILNGGGGITCGIDGGNYAAIVRPPAMSAYANNINHQESTFDEPPYGMSSSYQQHLADHHGNSTNDSAMGSSPTTTLVTSSTGSSSAAAAAVAGVYSRPGDCSMRQLNQQLPPGNGSAANVRGSLAAVYLCNRGSSIDEQTGSAMNLAPAAKSTTTSTPNENNLQFYANSSAQLQAANIYGLHHQTARQYHQGEAANKTTDDNSSYSQMLLHGELHVGGACQAQQQQQPLIVRHHDSLDEQQQQQQQQVAHLDSGGNKLENCFMTLVEEVAKANEIAQRQASSHSKTSSSLAAATHYNLQRQQMSPSQSNQLDHQLNDHRYNHHHHHHSHPHHQPIPVPQQQQHRDGQSYNQNESNNSQFQFGNYHQQALSQCVASSDLQTAIQNASNNLNESDDQQLQQQQQLASTGEQQAGSSTNQTTTATAHNVAAQLNCKQTTNESSNLMNSNNSSSSNRLVFDPVYATIRRTFPQAFRYLTLQQPTHQQQQHQQQHQHQHQHQHQQHHHPLRLAEGDADQQQQIAYHNQSARQQMTDPRQYNDDVPFDSNNLAALNLLLPNNNNHHPSTNFIHR